MKTPSVEDIIKSSKLYQNLNNPKFRMRIDADSISFVLPTISDAVVISEHYMRVRSEKSGTMRYLGSMKLRMSNVEHPIEYNNDGRSEWCKRCEALLNSQNILSEYTDGGRNGLPGYLTNRVTISLAKVGIVKAPVLRDLLNQLYDESELLQKLAGQQSVFSPQASIPLSADKPGAWSSRFEPPAGDGIETSNIIRGKKGAVWER